MTPEAQELTALVRGARSNSGAFHPFAVYDEKLDCIRVMWRDCSDKEIRVSDLVTIVVDRFSDTAECVGVTIKGVAHICETCDIPPDAPWKLADFIDAVLKLDTPIGRRTLKREVKPELEERQIDDVEKLAVA
jgi:hypothetical protein